MRKKELIIVGAAIAVAFAVAMFYPVIATAAGNVEIPPAWSQKLDASKRFVLVLDGEAVLDKETGLVWEREPSQSKYYWPADGPSITANGVCSSINVGGRRGWHLPTLEQISSLFDPSVSGEPKLPQGHPFIGVLVNRYWTVTSCPGASEEMALSFEFSEGYADCESKYEETHYRWCVRGGQTHDFR